MNAHIHDLWLGKIEGWRLQRLRDHFSLLNGFPFSSEDFNTAGEGLPLVRIRDLFSGQPETFYNGPKGYESLLLNEDIVIGMDGDFNVGWWTHGPALLNQRLCALRPKGSHDTRFAFYQLPIALKIINDLTPSSTVKHLSSFDVLALRLPAPELAQQRAIAAYLDRETTRLDQLIAKKERQARVFAEREEATFLGMVTGQERGGPKAYSGVDWIGDIPSHWIAPKFTHVARQETGHTPSRKEEAYWMPDECVIPWFSLADVWQIRDGNRVYVDETSEKISEIGVENSAARLLPVDTVILSRTASVGFSAILSVPMATTQDFVGWVCGNRLRPKYLYYVLRSMRPVFRRLMMGSTHQTIYMPDIRSFRLPLPPIDEQDAIICDLDSMTGAFRSAAGKITESVQKLKEKRTALITAAVTGQIDISEQVSTLPKPDRSRFLATVSAEIVHLHRNSPKFGHVKLQKELYLAEAHVGISELQGEYLRQAAGPYDRALIDEVDRLLEAEGFYQRKQPEGAGTAVTYVPLGKAGQHGPELKAILGPRFDALRDLIAKLRDLDRRAIEAVATLYAVWNDALMDGVRPSDTEIVKGVLTEWHAEKGEKFKASELETWLGWMRRQRLVPSGSGPRTRHTMTRDLFS